MFKAPATTETYTPSLHAALATSAREWGIKGRLPLGKSALGFYLSGHLCDQSAAEVRRFCKLKIADLVDSREVLLVAGIVGDLRVVNGQRGRVAIFKLDDMSESIEAVANEDLLNANRDLLKDDELVIAQGKVQPDRFSGGVRFNVSAVWDLAGARCRFGKYLRVEVNGSVPPVAEVLRDFPTRKLPTEHGHVTQGLGVRLVLERELGNTLTAGCSSQWYDFGLGWTGADARLMEVVGHLKNLEQAAPRIPPRTMDPARPITIIVD